MVFSLVLGIAGAALIIALIDLWYTINVKKKMLHTLTKIELEQKRGLFESIYKSPSELNANSENFLELVKKIKEIIASKLNLRPGLTYPQLIKELDNKGIPAELKDKLSDIFSIAMKVEYSNKKVEDTGKAVEEAKEIIKTLGLNRSATGQSR